MFASAITTTPVTSEIADSVLGKVHGDLFRGDVSLTATLRLLLHNRIKDGEELRIRVRESQYRFNEIKDASIGSIVGAFVGNPNGLENGTFMIHYLTGNTEDDRKKIVDMVGSKFLEEYKDWKCVTEITELFHKSFGAYCFVNPEKKVSILFVEKMSMKIWHYLQCATFGYFPWYFERKPGCVSKDEFDFVMSFHEETSEKYISFLKKFSEQFDFRSANIKRLLTGYEKIFAKNELRACEESQRSINESIAGWERSINQYMKEIYALQIKMMGLTAKLNEDISESEVMDYFLANKHLVLESVNGTEIGFGVRDYLEYFDPEAAESYIKNRSSYFYSVKPLSFGMANDDYAKLLRKIFVDQDLKIRFCAYYKIDIQGSVNAISGHSFNSEYDQYMPNPHIQRYHCLGDHSTEIRRALKTGNVVGGIEQCIASAKSLNFHDSPVMTEFTQRFCDKSTKPFIELPDGTVVTPIDALKWIQDEEKKAAEEAERKKREAEEAAKAAAEASAKAAAPETVPAKPPRKRKTKKSAETPVPAVAAGDMAAVAAAAAEGMADEFTRAAEETVNDQEVVDG